MIDPNFIVATTQVGGYPLPVVGVVDPASSIGLVSVFISDTVALHVPTEDVFLTGKECAWYLHEYGNHELSSVLEANATDLGEVNDYEFLATLIYCLAENSFKRHELAIALRMVVKAHRKLVAQVEALNKERAN